MDVASCQQCRTRYGLNPKLPNNNLKCPQCKTALIVEAALEPRKNHPQSAPTALSLDDDDAFQPGRGDTPKRGAPGLLVAGLVAFGLLILVGGGIAAWVLLQDKPAETADSTPVESDRKGEKVEPAPVKPDAAPTSGRTPASKSGDAPSATSAAPKPLTGEQINLRLLKSTAFIVTVEEDSLTASRHSLRWRSSVPRVRAPRSPHSSVAYSIPIADSPHAFPSG